MVFLMRFATDPIRSIWLAQ